MLCSAGETTTELDPLRCSSFRSPIGQNKRHQVLPGGGERPHAFALQFGGECSRVDAGACELRQHRFGLPAVRREHALDRAVVGEGLERGARYGVDGIGCSPANQRIMSSPVATRVAPRFCSRRSKVSSDGHLSSNSLKNCAADGGWIAVSCPHSEQKRPGHSKLESTVRYLGIEVDDALEISEQTEI